MVMKLNLCISAIVRPGEWDESTDVKQCVTLTKRHKTAGMFLNSKCVCMFAIVFKTNGCRVRVMFDVKFTIASYRYFSLNDGAIITPTNIYDNEFILDAVM